MSKKDHGRCFVCDDAAIGLNFGVPTCMPCKAFFRRNATKLGVQQYVCQNDGDCIISYKFRRSCNCCRLAKCFRVGMDKGMILSDEERGARNQLVEINRLKRGKIPKQQCAKWMQPSPLLIISTNPLYGLRPNDQVILGNIFDAYENNCTVAKNVQLQRVPDIQYTSLHEYCNEISFEFRSCIQFLNHIPEFARFTIDDRVRLLKNHFGIIANMSGPMMRLMSLKNAIITWTNVFGIEIAQRLLKSSALLQAYLNDPMILKLLIVILVLSSSNGRNLDYIDIDQICDDPLGIFSAQNIYVEILWRYILSRSASHKHAVQFFNKLIMCVLYMKNLDMDIDNYMNDFRWEIEQMDPIVKNMWPNSAEFEEIIDMDIIDDSAL
ncbi:unnamed protein product [Adineta ricciae]|uniref:Nuclear receptor domain-containing protein n=1 Tax=Adineta ricciae TaxID=249248 RepID=A0A814DGH3_ADIRI|nr:unnamed protein product [Adineta ricciae]